MVPPLPRKDVPEGRGEDGDRERRDRYRRSPAPRCASERMGERAATRGVSSVEALDRLRVRRLPLLRMGDSPPEDTTTAPAWAATRRVRGDVRRWVTGEPPPEVTGDSMEP